MHGSDFLTIRPRPWMRQPEQTMAVNRSTMTPMPKFSAQNLHDEFVLRHPYFGSELTTEPSAERTRGLTNIFYPNKIALIGASPSEGTIGRDVLENIVESGFTGAIYPINPKHAGKTMAWAGENTQSILSSADELPENEVDMAVIMTPAKTVPGIVRSLGEKGVKSVVVISAGFNEAGGAELEAELVKAVDEYGMTMIGPNCVGVASTSKTHRMNATFADSEIAPGYGAIMSQSGAVSIDLFNKARLAGLGFSQMASIGNQTNVDSGKLIQHWAQDDNVRYVLGYLESIKDPVAFRKIATQVSKTKPIVLIKSGKSSAGAKAASSHTGSLAGSDTAVDALFEQSGVQRVDSIDELFHVAKTFEQAPPLQGNRVGIMSNSGGYGVMVADIASPEGKDKDEQLFSVAKLESATVSAIETLLPPAASPNNPVDVLATTPSDSPENFRNALMAMVKDPNVDVIVSTIVPLLNIDSKQVGRILAEVQAQTEKPILGVLSVSEAELLDVQKQLASEGLRVPPMYRTLESSMVGLEAMERHRRWSAKPVEAFVDFPDVKTQVVRDIIDGAKAEGRTLLTTTESIHMLEAYGIRTAPHALVNGTRREIKQQILAKAREFGYPAAIKLVSKTITHKTDVGGVAFDLKTPEALELATERMLDNLEEIGITEFAEGEGIMIQKSIPNGRETLIGFKEDEKFGKMMAFGLGGIYVNIFKDVIFRLNPLTEGDAQDMIDDIKGHKILSGYRGKPSVDFETLKETILRYSKLAQDFPELAESDINPFFAQPAGPDGKGGVAVDGRFALHGEGISESGHGSHHAADQVTDKPDHAAPKTGGQDVPAVPLLQAVIHTVLEALEDLMKKLSKLVKTYLPRVV